MFDTYNKGKVHKDREQSFLFSRSPYSSQGNKQLPIINAVVKK